MLEMIIQIGTIIIATYFIINYLITINLEDKIKSKLDAKEKVNMYTVLYLLVYIGTSCIMYIIISTDLFEAEWLRYDHCFVKTFILIPFFVKVVLEVKIKKKVENYFIKRPIYIGISGLISGIIINPIIQNYKSEEYVLSCLYILVFILSTFSAMVYVGRISPIEAKQVEIYIKADLSKLMDRIFQKNQWYLDAKLYDEDDLFYFIFANNEYMKIPKEQVLLIKEVKESMKVKASKFKKKNSNIEKEEKI